MYSPWHTHPITSGEPPSRPPDRQYVRRYLPSPSSYSQEPDSGYEASPATPTTEQHFFGPHDPDEVFGPVQPTASTTTTSDCDCCRRSRLNACDTTTNTEVTSSARSLPIGIPRPQEDSSTRVCSCSSPSTSPFLAPLAALAAQPRSWPSSLFSWMRSVSPSKIVLRQQPLRSPSAHCPVHGSGARAGQSSSGSQLPSQPARRRHRTLNDYDCDSLSSSSDSDDFSMLSLHEDDGVGQRSEPLPDLVLHSSPRRNRSVSVSLPIGEDPYRSIGRSLRRLSDQFEADRLPHTNRRQTMDNGVFRRSP